MHARIKGCRESLFNRELTRIDVLIRVSSRPFRRLSLKLTRMGPRRTATGCRCLRFRLSAFASLREIFPHLGVGILCGVQFYHPVPVR
jgi:hypothetical protein